MRRPRPIQRLIDGKPDAPGRAISARALLLATPATIVANAVGAFVVVVLAVFVLPAPRLDDRDHVLLVNLVAAAIYLAAAIAAGTIWGVKRLRAALEWLREERAPSEDERKQTLRVPLRQLRVNGVLWLIAAVCFTVINATYSGALAVMVGLTVLLGGVTTCATAYLLAERIARPMYARALSYGVPDRPVLPGVTTRALLAWALGSGVPLLGLTLVAILKLAGRDVGANELAATALGLGSVSLTVGLFVTWQAARSVADPVMSVREGQRRVERGDLEAEVPVFDGSELGLLQAGFNRMAEGIREREELRDMFGRLVGEDVAREALDRGIELGGEERDVAVLFVDLIGSTELASEKPPHEVVSLLNDFFGVVVEVVEGHGGWINKFEGDAALAVFGVPIPLDNAETAALAAARELGERLPDAVSELRAGIGVSSGRAVAGNIGSESRFEYTVIGDPVNEAARLCELAKKSDTGVLASSTTVECADDDEAGHWKLGDSVELRGRSEETRVAEPVG
ncbi:MAG: adenylate cyclase [Thermoleophilaceae bacterium]|nr:adenylate cyclase [Thermoleophilaceae bacterium]